MRIKNVYMIGSGGVASYLAEPLVKTLEILTEGDYLLTIIDRDKLERKNLVRQLFNPDAVGASKAEALAKALNRGAKVETRVEFFHGGTAVEEGSLLLGCVDNHVARKAILQVADIADCVAIIGGNEVTDSEAYYYEPKFRGTQCDPRLRYPEILTDTTDDPLKTGGCDAPEVLEETQGQTAIANYMAAAYMLHLFQAHFIKGVMMGPEAREHLPVEHASNFSKLRSTSVFQLTTKE